MSEIPVLRVGRIVRHSDGKRDIIEWRFGVADPPIKYEDVDELADELERRFPESIEEQD